MAGSRDDHLWALAHAERAALAQDLAGPDEPKSSWADLRLHQLLRELQYLLVTWLGFCPLCHAFVPT